MSKKQYVLCLIPVIPLMGLSISKTTNTKFANLSLIWLVVTSIVLVIYLLKSE